MKQKCLKRCNDCRGTPNIETQKYYQSKTVELFRKIYCKSYDLCPLSKQLLGMEIKFPDSDSVSSIKCLTEPVYL